MSTVQRRVVCAAVRDNSDGLIICGPRHFDSAMHQVIGLLDDVSIAGVPPRQWENTEQGFVDQFGVFMTREEAWAVASAANQIYRRCGGDGEKLYSENLY